MKVTPYQDERSKKEQVAGMFDNIAPRYDFLNRFLSAGIDQGWRKKTVKAVQAHGGENLLDVATGTGDLAIALAKSGFQVTGLDLSHGMLEVGREKVKSKNLEDKVKMVQGDSENLPFESDHFDLMTAAFGVRNFENLEKGLSEMHRTLKPNGMMAILEFSQPEAFPFKQVYNFYFKNILPTLGKALSKDPKAYGYLHDSVQAFPYGDEFKDVLEKIGFKEVKTKPLTMGIASLYTGIK